MNRRLIIRPEAETDIINGALWYVSREPGVGLELIAEVNSAILRLVKNPDSFTLVRQNPIVHRALTRRFPYRVFFIVRHDAIVVFAVIHASRHDRVWKHRAKRD